MILRIAETGHPDHLDYGETEAQNAIAINNKSVWKNVAEALSIKNNLYCLPQKVLNPFCLGKSLN
jgi:hypothetical protein